MLTMHILKHLTISAACAWGALMPLQAEPAPEEIYTRLSAPARPVPMRVEQRARCLPALSHLPAKADMVVAMVEPGHAVISLMKLLGVPVSPETEAGAASIRDAALLAGVGSARTLDEAMPAWAQVTQPESLRRLGELWAAYAVPEQAELIRKAFQWQSDCVRRGAVEALAGIQPAPIYCALTAQPGREAAFARMHEAAVAALRRAAEGDADLHYEEVGAFRGVRATWLYVYRLLMHEAPADAELSRALDEHEVYLLVRAEAGVAWYVLCAAPSDIRLPQSPEFSMLASSALSGADAHIEHLLATAWAGPDFNRIMRRCMHSSRLPLVLAAVHALHLIAAQDADHSEEYGAAARSLMRFIEQPPYFDAVQSPISVQVWQAGPREVCVESVSDACGMQFEPGKLQFVHRGTAPTTGFYMESSAFSAPHERSFVRSFDAVCTGLLEAAQGIALTLREPYREPVEAALRFGSLIRNDIRGMGQAVGTMGEGLAAPFALLGAPCESGTGWALCTGVSSRSTLAQGWDEFQAATAAVMQKAGLSGAEGLPVTSRRLGQGSTAYTLHCPGIGGAALLNVALSDTRLVLGNEPAYNEALLGAAPGDMPFCGAVSAVRMPFLASALANVPEWGACGHMAQALQRIAEQVSVVYSVSTIHDGMRTARALLILRAPANER